MVQIKLMDYPSLVAVAQWTDQPGPLSSLSAVKYKYTSYRGENVEEDYGYLWIYGNPTK